MAVSASPEQVEAFQEYEKLEVKIKKAKAELADLENQKKIARSKILVGTLKSKNGDRILPDGSLLRVKWTHINERVATEVGQVISNGYSYPTLSHVAPK